MTQQESSENETDDDENDGAENANADVQSGDGQSQTGEAGDGQSQTDNATAGLLEVRDTVRQQVPSLVNKELDTVTAIRSTDDGWQATVELVERHAVPNTQDILGRYEFDLDDDATIVGYRRIETYNRGDQTYDEM